MECGFYVLFGSYRRAAGQVNLPGGYDIFFTESRLMKFGENAMFF